MTPEGAEIARSHPQLMAWHTRMQARQSFARTRPKAA